jgi:predicted aspartyl protease
MRSLHLAGLFLAFGATAALAAPGSAPDEVELSIGRSGAIRVPVTIDEQGPFRLLLDTGSSHSTLSRELAQRLGLPLVAQVKVATPGGVQVQPVVQVEQMAIGIRSVPRLMPSVVSSAELRSLERGIDGVVGQDFLGAFDFTIDYRRKRLRWTAGAADTDARLPLVRAGDRALVALAANESEVPVLLVPDSGTDGFVIFERDGRTAVKLEPVDALADVSALGVRQAARGAILRSLTVGAVTLRDEPTLVVSRQGAHSVEGDGLLPLHRFSSVSFSNSEAYLVVRR